MIGNTPPTDLTPEQKRALLKRLLQQRATTNRRAPVSFGQQRMWLLNQLDPTAATFNLHFGLRLRGPLDLPALEDALAGIVQRHESLRTTFEAVDGIPEQVVHEHLPVHLTQVDLSAIPHDLQAKHYIELGLAERLKPFDLVRGPLWRATLQRLGEQEHILFVVVHHIMADAWSLGVLFGDLGRFYDGRRIGQPCSLEPLPLQLIEVTARQQEALLEKLQTQLTYWKHQLAGIPPALNLPYDGSCTSAEAQEADTRSRLLDISVFQNLKGLARSSGVTPFVTILAVFQVLLQRICGEDDIVVGSPIAGRTMAHTEALIGYFVNILVLRTDLSGQPTFRSLLGRVRETTYNAFENQDVPFERLIEELKPERVPGRTPFFQVYLNMLGFQAPPPHFAGLETEVLPQYQVEANFDLTLYVTEKPSGLHLSFMYRKRLFTGARVEELLRQFEAVLRDVLENPDRPIDEINLVTADSRDVLPNPAAPLVALPPVSSLTLCLAELAQGGQRVALKGANAEWTFEQLHGRANRVAQLLLEAGVRRGEVIGIYARRDPLLVCAMLGVLRAGAAFAIFDPAYPDVSLTQRWRAAAPQGMIQIAGPSEPGSQLTAALSTSKLKIQFELSEETFSGPAPVAPPLPLPELSANDLAYIAFTSGTTGGVKAIAGNHGPVIHFLDWQRQTFDFVREDRFTMLSGLSHDPLLRDVFAPLCAGACLCIPNSALVSDASKLAKWIQDHGVSITHLTPALAQFLGHASPLARLNTLRLAFFGGDILRAETVAQFRQLAPSATCVNFYGATETPQAMSYQVIAPEETNLRERIPIGHGIDGVQLLIVNGHGKLAGVGELGEIFVRTPWLSRGYLGGEELIESRFCANPITNSVSDRVYRTGDFGRYLPNGSVEFANRMDHQVKIRGYRVELGEIESILAAHKNIVHCVVIVDKEKDGSPRILAYLVHSGTVPPSVGELRTYLGSQLPDYMIPAAFVFLETIPLTPNGKIDRKALPIPTGSPSAPPRENHVAPRNRIETLMAEIWSDVLGVKTVGVFDHFFELGGHSLSATRLIAKLNATFGLEIPLRQLFVEPTIAALAALVRYDESIKSYLYVGGAYQWKRLVPAQPKGSQIPLFFVGGYTDPNDTWRILSNFIPHLGLDQPMYGLQPRWLDGKSDPYSSVEEVVSDYLAELRNFRPNGPYFLGGDCVGGVIALEMARELTRQGAEVGMLVMFDTERPTLLRDVMADVRVHWRRGKQIIFTLGQLVFSSYAVKKKLVSDIVRRKTSALHPEKRGELINERTYRLRVDYRRMLYNFRVEKYSGKAILIINEHQYRVDKKMGWDGVTAGLEIHVSPGDHLTRFTKHGREIAGVLSACLERARIAVSNK